MATVLVLMDFVGFGMLKLSRGLHFVVDPGVFKIQEVPIL